MARRLIARPALLLGLLLTLALPALAGDADVKVHITDTGKKYHRARCRYLRQSDYVITLEEARRR